MERPSPFGQLQDIFGSDGPWVLTVLAVLGVGATFFSFGWPGVVVLVLIILLLLVVVFGKAALWGPVEISEEGGEVPTESDDTYEHGYSHATHGDEGLHEAQAVEAQDASSPDGSSDEASDTPSAFVRGVDAAISGDADAAREALDEWVAEVSDPDQVLLRMSMKELALARAGDHGALERLEQLADNNPKNADLQQTYGDALAKSGAKRRAADEFANRREGIEGDSGRAKVMLAEANTRLELGEVDVATMLCSEVCESSDRSVASKACTLRAEIANDKSDLVLALGYYQRAVVIDPTNSHASFQLAYVAGTQAELPEVAIYHYGLLEKGGNANAITVNNLGSTLEQGGAVGLSRDYWRRASEMGNSLATGNLANAAAAAGFLDEANTFARAVANEEGVSSRVGEALEHIAETRQRDSETRKNMEDQGTAISDALVRFMEEPAPALPSGSWNIHGTTWVFTAADRGAEASQGQSAMCRVYLDEQDRLRFKLKPSPHARLRSGFAVGETAGDGILLVALGTRISEERVTRMRPTGS